MNPPHNRKFVIIGFFLVVVILFLAALTYVISNVTHKQTAGTTQISGAFPSVAQVTTFPGSTTKSQAVKSAPSVNFASWVEPSIAPIATSSSSIYRFKQNYTEEDVRLLADKLGAGSTVKRDGDKVLAYSLEPQRDVNILDFNTKTGSFSYLNTAGVPLTATTSGTTETKVYDFLRRINVYDPTLKMTASYKRKDSPGVTVYEVHRNWDNVGLPILNFEGMFNIPMTQQLSSLTMNAKLVNLPSDENVYATSDSSDGYQRATDFNTISIFVTDKDQKVVGITSNLRQLQPVTAQSTSVISYQTALTRLKANQYDYIFTSPTGTGQVDFNKIYPNNKAISDKAIITESVLVYLEKLPYIAQKDLHPYYVFRGTSQLTSGYAVNFIAAVSALPNAQARASVLGVSTLAQTTVATPTPTSTQGGGASQANITFTPDQLTNPPTLPPNQNQPRPDQCHPTKNDFVPPYVDMHGIKLGFTTRRWVYKTASATHPETGWEIEKDKDGKELYDPRWYWIPPDDLSSQSPTLQLGKLYQDYQTILLHRHEFDSQELSLSNGQAGFYSKNRQGNEAERPWDLILKDFLLQFAYSNTACPNVFTGLSPVIFVYGSLNQTIDISPRTTLTYADPSTDNSIWHVKVTDTNSLRVNNQDKGYIYYEYAKQTFTRPQNGWNTTKKDLSNLIKSIASKLQLNASETDRLKNELQNAAGGVNSDLLFVGLINSQEVNQKIPLYMSPIPPTVARYHFYIGKADGAVLAPHLQPVKRDTFMVLELGAVPQE